MDGIVPPPWELTGSGIMLLYRFPKGWVLEHGRLPNRLRGAFVGGIGAVILADYTASGVGPYREALFIPGQFRSGGRLRSMITRIVVSSQPSVNSGRANWGIPKELADFEVAGHSIRVSAGGAPILEVAVEPLGPDLPVDTRWLPLPIELGQLAEGRMLITRPAGRGAVRLARLRSLRANPDAFPDTSAFRPLLAARATGFTLTFPAAAIEAPGASG